MSQFSTPRVCANCLQQIITTWPPTEHVCQYSLRQDFDTWWFRQRKIVVGTDKRTLARAAFDEATSMQQAELQSLRAQLTTLQAKLEAAEKDAAAKQAEIDRLMLEYCPDEMTPEQLDNWAAYQASIEDAAIAASKED